MKSFLIVCLISAVLLPVRAAESKASLIKNVQANSEKVHLLQKERRITLYRASDEIAQLNPTAGQRPLPETTGKHSWLGYRIVQAEKQKIKTMINDASRRYMQVFYRGPIRSARTRYVATGTVVVQLEKNSTVVAETVAAANNLNLVKAINPELRIYLFEPIDKNELIETCNRLTMNPNIKYAEPEWVRPQLLR